MILLLSLRYDILRTANLRDPWWGNIHKNVFPLMFVMKQKAIKANHESSIILLSHL